MNTKHQLRLIKPKNIATRKDGSESEKEVFRYLTVDTPTLQKMLCCGRATAVQIGILANAKIQVGKRVLWNVNGVQRFLDKGVTIASNMKDDYIECV